MTLEKMLLLAKADGPWYIEDGGMIRNAEGRCPIEAARTELGIVPGKITHQPLRQALAQLGVRASVNNILSAADNFELSKHPGARRVRGVMRRVLEV